MGDAEAPEVKFVERRLDYMQFLASTEQIERIAFLYSELLESKKRQAKSLARLGNLRYQIEKLTIWPRTFFAVSTLPQDN